MYGLGYVALKIWVIFTELLFTSLLIIFGTLLLCAGEI